MSRLKLKAKLLLVIITLFIAMGISTVFILNGQVRDLLINEKIDKDIKMINHMIDVEYPGHWSIKNNQLYKGEDLISGNNELVDEIKELTGNAASIFL